MGGPCDILIPVAVLYDNPNGLNFEEFYNKVNFISTKVGYGYLSWWRKNKYLFSEQILNLPYTKDFEKIKRLNYDKEFKYFRERFSQVHGLEVIKKKHALLEDKVIFDVDTDFIPNHHEGYLIGDYLEYDEKTYWVKDMPEKYREDQLIEIQITSVLEKGEPYLENYEHYRIKQKLEGRPVKFETIKETFENEEEVAKQYPKYSLENIYDFSPDSWWLFPSSERGTKAGFSDAGPGTFRWKRKGSKYFLDKDYMFSHLSPNSVYARDSQSHWSTYSHIDISEEWVHPGNKGIFSFSDLILTVEAIKKENWNLLSYTGNRHYLLEFLYNNEDSLKQYETSVLETELYMLAKKLNWTNSEYIRAHIEMCQSRTYLDLEIAREELNKFRDNELEAKREWAKKCEKERLKEKKSDLPF